MLNELPADMEGMAKTPTANYLFTVSDDARKLSEENRS